MLRLEYITSWARGLGGCVRGWFEPPALAVRPPWWVAGAPPLDQLAQAPLSHLVWVLGFRLHPDPSQPWGFDAERSLPTHRHFSRAQRAPVRELPNAALQFLLKSSVQVVGHAIHAAPEGHPHFGDELSRTVKEKNPQCFVEDRFDKTKQPKGDPDCKLGCKKKSNQGAGPSDEEHELPATPTTEAWPASETLPKLEKGEYYWGYASGVVATKVDDYAEFVLADFTQTFDKGDITYFFPLMAQTEANLGRPPQNGALDKAYDAFYGATCAA